MTGTSVFENPGTPLKHHVLLEDRPRTASLSRFFSRFPFSAGGSCLARHVSEFIRIYRCSEVPFKAFSKWFWVETYPLWLKAVSAQTPQDFWGARFFVHYNLMYKWDMRYFPTIDPEFCCKTRPNIYFHRLPMVKVGLKFFGKAKETLLVGQNVKIRPIPDTHKVSRSRFHLKIWM